MKSFHINGFQISELSFDGYTSKEVCVVSTESLARSLCNENNFYHYKPINKVIVIFESLQEIEALKQNEIREKALAKLTKEEREVLGV